MPSYGGSNGPDGSKKTGDQGQGTRDPNGGNTGGGKSVGGGGFGGALGGTKKAGNPTVADHMIATGRINVPSIGPNGMSQGNYPTQDDAYNDFARALGDYATRGFFGRAADYALGPFYDQQEPISQNPRTFAEGTYHDSLNPGGVAGSIAGMALGIPGLGLLGGYGYNALGGPNVSYGGYSQPDTGAYSDPSGGWGGSGAPSSPGSQMGDNKGGQGGALSNYQTPKPPGALSPEVSTNSPQVPAQQPNLTSYSQPGYNYQIPGLSPYGYQTPNYNYWGR